MSAKKNILVIDDDVMILRLVRDALGSLATCSVDTTPSSEYAFELTLRKPYDLLIVDFSLPRIDGALFYSLVTKVFSIIPPGGRPQPPMLLMSGHAAERRAQELLREPGVRGLVAKPFTIDRLIEAVTEILGETPPQPRDSKPTSGPA